MVSQVLLYLSASLIASAQQGTTASTAPVSVKPAVFSDIPVIPNDSTELGISDTRPRPSFDAITPDGRYVLYTLRNVPSPNKRTTVLQATDGTQRRVLPDVGGWWQMTRDGRTLVTQGTGDSAWLLPVDAPDRAHARIIPHVTLFQQFQSDGDEWMIYLTHTTDDTVVLHNFRTGDERVWPHVNSYRVSPRGTVLLLSRTTSDSGHTSQLSWVDRATGDEHLLWRGAFPDGIAFDVSEARVIFTTLSADSTKRHLLWYYHRGDSTPRRIMTNGALTNDPFWSWEGTIPTFSRDGQHLIVFLTERRAPPAPVGAVNVDIWHYADRTLQADQRRHPHGSSVEGMLTLPATRDDTLETLPSLHMVRDTANVALWGAGAGSDQLVVRHTTPSFAPWWDPTQRSAYTLETPVHGTRRVLQQRVAIRLTDFHWSPDGAWIVYYDPNIRHWQSVVSESGEAHVISRSIPVPLFREPIYPVAHEGTPPAHVDAAGFAGWITTARISSDAITPASQPTATAALVYDHFDVWQVDVQGRRAPINVTAGYGRRHHLIFRLAVPQEFDPRFDAPSYVPGDTIVLSAYSPTTKVNGFCRVVLPRAGGVTGSVAHDPDCGTLSQHAMYIEDGQLAGIEHRVFLAKARDANVWVVLCESATEAPNFFVTRDFRTYTPVTDVHPDRAYNWVSAELVAWTTATGQRTFGVLYKPENFDPHRRYPVIVSIYEEQSDKFTIYPEPDWTHDALNVPYFASRGYLVFLPDIYKRWGEIGPSALDAVTSGVRALTKRSYVDGAHVGLMGHSFGGYETNYIVAHSRLFAAAVASAGMSDLVSDYGSLRGAGGLGQSNREYYETGQAEMGASPWQDLARYLRNSPLFRANHVTTPLLLVHNRQDANVPFQQGIEWFSALQRNHAHVWMLQYDEGTHGVRLIRDARDMTQRVEQFFDHYLKGAPPPVWMTRGVPAYHKGNETGLELETLGRGVQ